MKESDPIKSLLINDSQLYGYIESNGEKVYFLINNEPYCIGTGEQLINGETDLDKLTKRQKEKIQGQLPFDMTNAYFLVHM
jgi:hypothetical protein